MSLAGEGKNSSQLRVPQEVGLEEKTLDCLEKSVVVARIKQMTQHCWPRGTRCASLFYYERSQAQPAVNYLAVSVCPSLSFPPGTEPGILQTAVASQGFFLALGEAAGAPSACEEAPGETRRVRLLTRFAQLAAACVLSGCPGRRQGLGSRRCCACSCPQKVEKWSFLVNKLSC